MPCPTAFWLVLIFLGSTTAALGQPQTGADNKGPAPDAAIDSGAQPQSQSGGVADLDIGQLMNTKVTSVSKREQKISQVAAAIYVITQEDIRRSGATNVPDLLRMVPGLDVAQINASSWAVSARGFNHQFSDKLLVLIDGRVVYTPLFAGVYWGAQDVVLEDIERIEVIRGPGATVWGANAVNGVINIITKSTAETQGGLITAADGTQELGMGVAQYGGKIGRSVSYRVFGKGFDHNHFPDLNDGNGGDGWHLLHGGFRADTSISPSSSVTVQGDIYDGNEGSQFGHIVSIVPPVNANVEGSAPMAGGNILSRWNHAFSRRSDVTLQAYFDRFEREGPESRENRNTVDLDFQPHFALSRHDLIWGFDLRHTADYTVGTIDQAWLPPDRQLTLFDTFAQDEIKLRPDRVLLTLGTKLENNYLSGWDAEPSARVAWNPRSRETLWAAVSRADRSPARRYTDADINIAVFSGPGGTPTDLLLLGNPRQESEHVIAYEAGYRAQATGQLSVDLALFFNRYTDLSETEPGTPFLSADPPPTHLIVPLVWSNKMHGTTQGAEFFANWKVARRWTLRPGYSFLKMHLRADANSLNTTTAANTEGSSPSHQAQLLSSLDLPHGFVWEAGAYFVERLPA